MMMVNNSTLEQANESELLDQIDGSALVVKAAPIQVVDYMTLGTDEFRPPRGGLDTEVHLVIQGGKSMVTVAELLHMHHRLDFERNEDEFERLRDEQTLAMQQVTRDRLRQADPRAELKEARKREIMDYVRVNPGMTKNSVYQAVGGKKSATLQLIAELVEDGRMILTDENKLRLL